MTFSDFCAYGAPWFFAGLVLFVACSVGLHRLANGEMLDVPALLAVAILLFPPIGVAFLALILRDIRRMRPKCPEPRDPDEIWFPDSRAASMRGEARPKERIAS